MTDKTSESSRRAFLSAATRLTVAGAVAPMVGLPVAAQAATAASATAGDAAHPAVGNEYGEADAQHALDSLESAYGVHPAKRRNHTKGVGVLGQFVGSPAAPCST
ncbi:hypothetical protein [Burkholderia gladioli]|uniref:hypothetical protein n=1 Tax=Burkholderia gladioli TaxID=28095 RepID=UPI001FC87AE5|nr:hypothetical protein [Burkholderia gladioli]